ncbi:MAG: site-2 protease family protein [Simkaniaceae bacterium]|nr:site-2 protease family protein [Simkaniaceae bacterium]
MITFAYIILALLGLSFLIFIHEMGHYLMAKRVGMRVEVFSIGFGKPFFSFMIGKEKWQFCYVLVGGYVKIAGMEGEKGKEAHEIEGGFYNARPIDRIKVAIMGPLVNIVFAFLAFTAIYVSGGRDKEFHEQTNIVGFIDPKSDLYTKGVRPGDTITSIDGRKYESFKDIMYTSVSQQKTFDIKGEKVNYWTGEKTPFDYGVASYEHPYAADKEFKTVGILAPANYLIYNKFPDGRENPIPQTSPMAMSGIQYGDRIIWVDGELIFSLAQLRRVINEPITLLTIDRDGKTLQMRVPRMPLRDMRLSRLQLSELSDWQHEVGLKGDVRSLSFIPFNIDSNCYIENALTYVDDQARETNPTGPLKPGDRIIAVDGQEVVSGYQVLKHIQSRQVQIIVERDPSVAALSTLHQDARFEKSFDQAGLAKLTQALGTYPDMRKVGSLHLLNPVKPVSREKFDRSEKKQEQLDAAIAAAQERIDNMPSGREKTAAIQQLENYKNQLFLGIALQDRMVNYNPSPMVLFGDFFDETGRTLKGLFTGNLKPKWLSGPVGIVHVMQHSWSLGFAEAMYWLALISLNLGILNLLPIPALDGGHICFSLYEWITRSRIKSSSMEKMVIPFVVLLILFLAYVTYQDVVRLVTKLF